MTAQDTFKLLLAEELRPDFNICACCGCEFGYEDRLPRGIRGHREQWIANGGTWFHPTERPAGWTIEDHLSKVPRFYFRVLAGLPATGEPPVRFNVTGRGLSSEGFVVEFTCASGQKWIGNFQRGVYGKNGVFTVLGRHRWLTLTHLQLEDLACNERVSPGMARAGIPSGLRPPLPSLDSAVSTIDTRGALHDSFTTTPRANRVTA